MRVRHLRLSDYQRMPWKNGRGSTLQMAIGPEGASFAGDFEWRVSAAEVSEDGEFSTFPGYDRLLAIWEGRGLRLAGVAPSELQPGMVHRFSGDDVVRAELIEGPVRDFGVMVKRGVWSASVKLMGEGAREFELGGADLWVLVCAAGIARVTINAEIFILGAEESLLVEPAAASAALGVIGREAQAFMVILQRK